MKIVSPFYIASQIVLVTGATAADVSTLFWRVYLQFS